MGRQVPDELSDHGSPDRSLPSLSLNVNGIESEAVFFDDPIDAVISRSANYACRILEGSSVTHCYQELNHKPLEKGRGDGSHSSKNFGDKRRVITLKS